MKRLGTLSIDRAPLTPLPFARDGVNYYTCMVYNSTVGRTDIMDIPVVVFEAMKGPCSACPAKPLVCDWRTTYKTADGHVRETKIHHQMDQSAASLEAEAYAVKIGSDDYCTERI